MTRHRSKTPPPAEPRMLTLAQVAERYGVRPPTIIARASRLGIARRYVPRESGRGAPLRVFTHAEVQRLWPKPAGRPRKKVMRSESGR